MRVFVYLLKYLLKINMYIYQVKFYEYVMYGVWVKYKLHRQTLFYSDYQKLFNYLRLNLYGKEEGMVGEREPEVWKNGSGNIVYVYQRELI